MVVHGLCVSAKRDFLAGVHQLGDTYRMALYGQGCELTPATTHYTDKGEVIGSKGYRRGGVDLRNPKVWNDSNAGYLTFDSVRLTNTTIQANAGLIYNASKGGLAIAVIDFGGVFTSTVGNFDINIPADAICFD